MNNNSDNFLTELAQQFKIAQSLPVSEHIKLLKNLEKIESTKLILILNYFLTIETNKEILIFLVKMSAKHQNDLTIDILSDMILSTPEKNTELDTNLKCEIANTLGKSKKQSCVLSLLYVLNNKDQHYKLRLACAEALGRIGSSYAVTPLIDIVNDNEEKSIYLRESAAKALGMLGDIRAIEPLANILENKNGLFDKFTFLKERVIEALGKLGQYGDTKSIKALKNALEDEAEYIRIGAIEALSEIDDEKVIPLIENMLSDKSEEVAKSAVFALYEILGTEYLKSLLKSDNIQKCCKDEIEELLIDEMEEIEVKKTDE